MARDHYEVLGVERTATPEEIKSAFRKAAAKHHPDKNPNDPSAAERFREANDAYQVLSDDGRRKLYDRFGHGAEQMGSPFGQGGPFAGGVVDMSDLNVDGILGDLLGVFGVGKGDNGDLSLPLELSFEEAVFGCDKDFTYKRITSCGTCNGSGAASAEGLSSCGACQGRGRVRMQQGFLPLAVERTCPQCKGRGKVVRDPCRPCRGAGLLSAEATIRVNVAPGVAAGDTMLIAGAGNKPRPERSPGALLVTFQVAPHAVFNRSGDDVLCRVPITFPQAALGAEVEVPTLEGKGKVRVPEGTQAGSVLRIRGKGVPKGGGARGDQLVEIAIDVPRKLTDRQRELMAELSRELGQEVTPVPNTFMDRLRTLFG
jgi:molecular chaperone DnaJ